MKKKKIFSLIAVTIFLGLVLAFQVSAQGILPEATGSSNCSVDENGNPTGMSPTDCGDYVINDFLALAIKISQFVFGILGSLTLLMFVYGGVMFLISAGSADKVGQAKKIITAAVVGLLIVFGSWLIINFVFKAMGLNWQGKVEIPTQLKPRTRLLR